MRAAARRIAAAESVSIFEDLGIQQAPHSTLNSYLEKLIYLLTGNFAKPGGMNIHTRMAGLGGGKEGGRTSPVGGHRIITGLIPANVIPDEILTDHPEALPRDDRREHESRATRSPTASACARPSMRSSSWW